jgi:hypothetical protein
MIRSANEVATRFGQAFKLSADGIDGYACTISLAGTQSLRVIASWGAGWEHVSVSLPKRCPTWDEMKAVKEAFWPDEYPVMQLHPPKQDYVNCHPYCLHLWRPVFQIIPLPPPIMVGPPLLHIESDVGDFWPKDMPKEKP